MTSLFAVRAALLFVLGASAHLATTQSRSPSQHAPQNPPHPPARRLTVIGIPNFAAITPNLYRGGQPRPEAFEKLKAMGVDIVVDLRLSGKATEKSRVTKAGMQFVSLPWHCLHPTDSTFAGFLALLHDNPQKKIFVHCRYGDDRTGMMIAAYRMAIEGWTRQEARVEMNKFGFHHFICAPLVRYENGFTDRLQNSPAFASWRTTRAQR